MKTFVKMSLSDSKYCRICLKIDRTGNLSKITGFYDFLSKFFGAEVMSSEIWLCVWCKASVRQALKLLKVAQQSQTILERCNQKPSELELNKNVHGPYNLSFTNHIHKDITPIQIEESCTFDEESTHEELLENSNLKEEILNPTKQSHSGKEEETGEENSHEEKFKKLNDKELKFEVKYLSFEEQLVEIEMKENKEKYKNMKNHCKDCGLGFLTEDIFREHMRRHEKKPNELELNKNAHGPYNLSFTNHIHEDITPIKIEEACTFDEESTHEELLENSNLEEEILNQTKQSHSGKEEETGEENSHEEKLKKLNYKELKFEIKYLSFEEQLAEIEMKKNKEKYKNMKYHCEDCGLGFLTEDVFREHMKRHEKVSTFKCPTCKIYLKSKDVLSQHILAHRRWFVCLSCGARVNRLRHCILHRYKCDNIQNVAVCGHCKKVFSNSLSLDVHKKGVHKKEKKYLCERCDRRFATKQRLDVHNRSHTNTRLFPCQLCAKSFTTHSNLRAHGLVHENSKQFYCVECNLYYKSNKGLKRHFRESKKHSVKLT